MRRLIAEIRYLWICHGIASYRPKFTVVLKSKDLATLGFQKEIHTHQLKLRPVSERWHIYALWYNSSSLQFEVGT